MYLFRAPELSEDLFSPNTDITPADFITDVKSPCHEMNPSNKS